MCDGLLFNLTAFSFPVKKWKTLKVYALDAPSSPLCLSSPLNNLHTITYLILGRHTKSHSYVVLELASFAMFVSKTRQKPFLSHA